MYNPEFTVWETVPRVLAEGLKVSNIEVKSDACSVTACAALLVRLA